MQIRYSQKLLGILAGLLVLFGSSLLIFLDDPSSLSAAELLTNPDFEDGANGWTTSPGTTIFTLVSSPVYSGNLAASVGSASNATKAIGQNVPGIVAGNRYTLSGYGYKDDPNVALVRLRVAWYTTDDCSGSQLATADSNELTADGPDFVFLSTGALTAPANTHCAQVRAQIQPVGSNPATAYFDNLRFVVDEEPPPPPITP
ncbi:MAG TPA: carbohydrate binding domain-containing protein, partial [Anaerolineae bacterium]|nr:carbohydrate binding domain-containing protein [Anaerolineae bacterium]